VGRERGEARAVGEDAPQMKELAIIHFDGGGQSPGPVTAACTVELSDGSVVQAVRRFDQGTHNTAEWHALILGLRLALDHGERHVVVKGDSTLVVKQVKREWKTKNPALLPLRTEAGELLAQFESSDVEWIPREENWRADKLGRGVMTLGPRVSIGGN
jgi:ribonuclease HI